MPTVERDIWYYVEIPKKCLGAGKNYLETKHCFSLWSENGKFLDCLHKSENPTTPKYDDVNEELDASSLPTLKSYF